MGKKKREHIVFDRMLTLPFVMLNRKTAARPPRTGAGQRRGQP